MRTSRISQETSKVVSATSPARRSTRSSLSRFAHNGVKAELDDSDSLLSTDIEDTFLPPKRKRASTVTPNKPNNSTSATPLRRVRKPARQIKDPSTGETTIEPPADWEEVYNIVKEMRTTGNAQNAAVDTMGCERLAEETVSERDKRFHTLTALMLSSQTKDTTNAGAMRRLQTELPPFREGEKKGLNLENILAVAPETLNELIWAVGFHNNKTKYIKAAAEILRDQYGGDIPDTAEGLMSLPGVGPKMAYLCLSAAWGKTEGIGVDVHVHRITNLWGWHTTKGPEESRIALQSWLPKDKWREINWLLVGFGQTVCLPVGRKCGDCEVGLKGLCKSAERGKVIAGRKVKEERLKLEENGELIKEEVIKEVVFEEDRVVNAPKNEGVDVKGQEEGPVEMGIIKKEDDDVNEANVAMPLRENKRRKR